jgi:hypothetical protein
MIGDLKLLGCRSFGYRQDSGIGCMKYRSDWTWGLPFQIIDKNGKPIPCDDLETWAQWFESFDRVIASDPCRRLVGIRCLSPDSITHGEMASRFFWESMIFDQTFVEKACDRCPGSREQAEAMHEKMVAAAGQMINENRQHQD